jgi:hypothetical protein
MSVADDYGRFYAAPGALRGACWPTCPERVTDEQVADWLSECLAGDYPLLITYQAGANRYLEILNFGQQTRSKSKFPDRLSVANQVISTCESPVYASRKSETVVGDVRRESKVAPITDQPGPDGGWKNARLFVDAWRRHLKQRRNQPEQVVMQTLIGRNGTVDWVRFAEFHPQYCAYWEKRGWDFCPLTLLEWIDGGMLPPPVEPISVAQEGATARSIRVAKERILRTGRL